MMFNNWVLKIAPDTFRTDSLNNAFYGFIANASISDSSGNLLFFSFGINVRNKLGAIMDGGCCLCQDSLDSVVCIELDYAGSPHEQGDIILPRPGSETQYYLFNKDESVFVPAETPARVTASLIDLTYNGGLGKVLRATTPILGDTLCDSRMTACLHANGRDWWLVNHKYDSPIIFTHLITPDSIFGPYEQNIGLPGPQPDQTGWSLFSPSGTLFASATSSMDSIELLDFDRCKGEFSNPHYINCTPDTQCSKFMAFSSNGRFLYSCNSTYLRQYDLLSSDIRDSSILLVNDTAAYPLLGGLVLMPDNKIYMCGWTGPGGYLSVIDSPNLKCPACGFHLRTVDVPGATEIHNVPNFPNYNLGPARAYQPSAGIDSAICRGDSIMLGTPAIDSVTYQWQSDSSILSANTNAAQILVKPTQTTTYYLTVTDTVPRGYSCNMVVDSVTVTVTTPCTVGINSIAQNRFGFTLHPNPANNYTLITLTGYAPGLELQVLDVTGQKVSSLKPQTPNFKLETSNLSAGVYFIKVSDANGNMALRKLVKE